MLKMVHRGEGRAAPAFYCDICGDRIEDANLAAIVYIRRVSQVGEKFDPLTVHKGNCHNVAERRLSTTTEDCVVWEELSIFLARLLCNSNVALNNVGNIYKGMEDM